MVTEDMRARAVSYIQHQAGKSRDALVDVVRVGQDKVLELMAAVDDVRSALRPSDDEWCLRELLLHVIASEGAVAALVQRLGSGTPVSIGDPGRAIGMRADDDGVPYGVLVDRLRQANERMLDAVRALPQAPDVALKAPHPWFGDLNCYEWAAFQRLHDEDHAQHARKILDAAG